MHGETCAKVELAQKQLALCHFRLLLGIDLPQQHHMAFDRSEQLLIPYLRDQLCVFHCINEQCDG